MFYEVVEVYHEYPMGYETERLNHRAFFEELDCAYNYCDEANEGMNNTIPSFDEVAEELQEEDDRADVGYLTIIVRQFEDKREYRLYY